MSLPTTRVLALLELLQTYRRLSGPELATHLGIKIRTLRRYIVKLEELGVPITAERGRGGAYMLMSGFKLPPIMFTDDEALAMSIGLLAAESFELQKNSVAAVSARAKLERVVSKSMKCQVRSINETLHFDAIKDNHGSTERRHGSTLKMLAAAAQGRQRVQIRYSPSTGAESSRALDAYGLVFRNRFWYVLGYCHLRKELRTFRLDRIEHVAPLMSLFKMPANFDLLKHLEHTIATLPRAVAVEVLLHTDMHTAQAGFTAAIGIFEPARGGTLLRTRTDDVAWFARQLARVSFDFQIRFPKQLRTAINAIGDRLKAK
jgi:predicted DNA-binding transcriptional regulator YafY